MWDNLFKLIVKISSVEPKYNKNHCLAYKSSTAACTNCQDICPHEAISFKLAKEVVIDDIDCSGCGLCVQVCPSQALEAKVSYQAGADIRCSKVKGNSQSVQCLGRLNHIDMLRLAGSKQKFVMARANCNNCNIGTEQVLQVLEDNKQKAFDLAKFLNRKLEVNIIETEEYSAINNPDAISRRDLLRGGWRGLQLGASDILEPFDPGEEDDNSLPKEMQYQKQIISLAKAKPQDLVPWRLPRVTDNCIMCPVCTNVCPTGAFSRDFEPKDLEGTVLLIEPDRCNGCDGCVKACPVAAIEMDDKITWAELSGGSKIAFYKDPSTTKDENIAR